MGKRLCRSQIDLLAAPPSSLEPTAPGQEDPEGTGFAMLKPKCSCIDTAVHPTWSPYWASQRVLGFGLPLAGCATHGRKPSAHLAAVTGDPVCCRGAQLGRLAGEQLLRARDDRHLLACARSYAESAPF